MGLGPGVGEGCLVSSVQCPVSSVQCPVSRVQDEEQNQEYEEKGRRRKLDEVAPLIIDPPPVQGGFSYSPWGRRRWQ